MNRLLLALPLLLCLGCPCPVPKQPSLWLTVAQPTMQFVLSEWDQNELATRAMSPTSIGECTRSWGDIVIPRCSESVAQYCAMTAPTEEQPSCVDSLPVLRQCTETLFPKFVHSMPHCSDFHIGERLQLVPGAIAAIKEDAVCTKAEASEPAFKALTEAAFAGLDADSLVDHHVHVFGNKPIATAPAQDKFPCDDPALMPDAWPVIREPGGIADRLKRGVILKIVGADASKLDHITADYSAHLLKLVQDMKDRGNGIGHISLLALDYHWDQCPDGEAGTFCKIEEKTDLMIPNDFVVKLAKCLNKKFAETNPGYDEVFTAVGSIHPADPMALRDSTAPGEAVIGRLEAAHAAGVRTIKWIPNAMNIDPRSEHAKKFLLRMAELEMTLLTHSGDEHALSSENKHQCYGNALLYQEALDQEGAEKLKIIFAHSGYKGPRRKYNKICKSPKTNAEAFEAMMAKSEYVGRVFGELSAVFFVGIDTTCFKGCKKYRSSVVHLMKRANKEYKCRLVSGSDYPLPGNFYTAPVRPLAKLKWLPKLPGFSAKQVRNALVAMRRCNPLLFDFVLKRTLRIGGHTLPKEVFYSQDSASCERVSPL